MPDAVTTIPPVHKVMTLPTTPQRAFELFTTHIGQWWPIATHSVGGERALSVSLEEGIGGRIIETLPDSTTTWGTITSWDPPNRIAFTWHAGTPESEASDVQVSFRDDDSGGTVVELVHAGWERRADGRETRDGYDTGWDVVVGKYERFVAATAGA